MILNVTIVLSSMLSWLDIPRSTSDSVVARYHFTEVSPVQCIHFLLYGSVRRMLSYPYLRHYGLAKLALEDSVGILKNGRRCLVRCLLHIKDACKGSEIYYLLNTL
jgi:protein SHQ1